MINPVHRNLYALCLFALCAEWLGFGACHFAALADTRAEIPPFITSQAHLLLSLVPGTAKVTDEHVQTFLAIVTGLLEVASGVLILFPGTRRGAAVVSLALLFLYIPAVAYIMGTDSAIPHRSETFRLVARVILIPNNILLALCAVYVWRNTTPRREQRPIPQSQTAL